MKHLIFALAITLSACGGKKEEKAPPAPPTVTGSAAATGSAGSAVVTAPATGSAAAGSAAAVDVPTEVDFEAKAKIDITDKNVDSKVKKIENDLGK